MFPVPRTTIIPNLNFSSCSFVCQAKNVSRTYSLSYASAGLQTNHEAKGRREYYTIAERPAGKIRGVVESVLLKHPLSGSPARATRELRQ